MLCEELERVRVRVRVSRLRERAERAGDLRVRVLLIEEL